MPKVCVHTHSAVGLYQSLGPFYRSLKEYYQQSVGKDLDKEQSLKTKNIFLKQCGWSLLMVIVLGGSSLLHPGKELLTGKVLKINVY